MHRAQCSGWCVFAQHVTPSTSSRMPIFQHPVCHSALMLQIRKDESAIRAHTSSTPAQKDLKQGIGLREPSVTGCRTRCTERYG